MVYRLKTRDAKLKQSGTKSWDNLVPEIAPAGWHLQAECVVHRFSRKRSTEEEVAAVQRSVRQRSRESHRRSLCVQFFFTCMPLLRFSAFFILMHGCMPGWRMVIWCGRFRGWNLLATATRALDSARCRKKLACVQNTYSDHDLLGDWGRGFICLVCPELRSSLS